MAVSDDAGRQLRFPLGRVVATPAAISALADADVTPLELVLRHVRADWGDLDDHDRRENDRALAEGTRLLSAFALPTGIRLWIITEADRSATTLLLPADY